MEDVHLNFISVGINCHFDPFVSLECVRKMKAGLDAAGKEPKKKNFYKPNLISTFLFFVSFFKFSWYEIIKLIFNIRLFRTGLQPYLFLQPIAYHTPDAGKQGVIDLPEFPFALEPRIMTR